MAGDEEKNGEPRNDDEFEKRFNELFNRRMGTFSKQVIDKLDQFSIDQSSTLDAKLTEKVSAMVDFMMPRINAQTNEIVERNIKALGEKIQAARPARPGNVIDATQPQVAAPGDNAEPQQRPPQPSGAIGGAAAGLLSGIANVLASATMQDVVEVVKMFKGNPQQEVAGSLQFYLKAFNAGIKAKSGAISPEMIGEIINDATGVKVGTGASSTPAAK